VLVPSLPGCLTQGDTLEEAVANAREAIEGHIAALEDLGQDISDDPVPPSLVTLEVSASPPAPRSAASVS